MAVLSLGNRIQSDTKDRSGAVGRGQAQSVGCHGVSDQLTHRVGSWGAGDGVRGDWGRRALMLTDDSSLHISRRCRRRLRGESLCSGESEPEEGRGEGELELG